MKKEKKQLTKQEKQMKRAMRIIALLITAAFIVGFLFGVATTYLKHKAKTDKASAEVMTVSASPITDEWVDLGEFTCYAYDPCLECCGKTDGITKTGTIATAGRTVAVDPTVIPLGSTLLIDGQEYIAEDIGGSIKGKKIDIYHNTHTAALEYGRQTHTVRIKKASY